MPSRGIVGGRLVAKILVADDNSNIQKMVGLALKDQGIDVVAVGNGEAAVRKISDIRPDLVLADVFMPVRNGYEVCQYVKSDPSLAHIPVILLVGAFDPLDEQEAQRVGADGVLKKPFVPPDPLISMVKSALQRAGVALRNATIAQEQEVLKASDMLTRSGATEPALASIPVQTASQEAPIADLDQESFVDEVLARSEPVRIVSDSQTVAFGSLLETPANEKEEEIGFAGPAHPELPERDWRDPDVEETDEETEEEKPGASWRHEETGNYGDAGSTSGKKDWRSGSFEQILARKTKAESWATAVLPASQEKSSTETATAVEEIARAKEREQASAETVIAAPQEEQQAEPERKAPEEPWFSVPSNPWNAEMEKANRLATAWDGAAPLTPPASPNGTEKSAEAASEATRNVAEEVALHAAGVDAIREEAAHGAEDATHVAEEQAASESFYARHQAAEAAEAKSNMDELVAKVLARMSPEVLQAVTREILKPVVEAMVKEEMQSKKS